MSEEREVLYYCHSALDDDGDSSYECPSNISNESSAPFDSSEDTELYDADTRDESFLDNMYLFVKECMSSEKLMGRLNNRYQREYVKQSYKSQLLTFTEQQQQTETEEAKTEPKNIVNRKFVRKLRYTPRICRENPTLNKWLQIILCFILPCLIVSLSLFMMALRAQDMQQLEHEKLKKKCVLDNTGYAALMKECMKEAVFSLQPTYSFNIYDFQQIFYITIILLSSFFAIKSFIVSAKTEGTQLNQFQTYLRKYKEVHKIAEVTQKISLNKLISRHSNQQS